MYSTKYTSTYTLSNFEIRHQGLSLVVGCVFQASDHKCNMESQQNTRFIITHSEACNLSAEVTSYLILKLDTV